MEGTTRSGNNYEEVCRRLIKAEMARRGLHWDDLSKDLQEVGISLSSPNLRRMFSMGTVRASVLLALIDLYEVKTINAIEIQQYLETIRRYPVSHT